MAEHGIEVKVDVSSCMHDALMDFAQYMFDKYGVKVSSVNFNWVATGMMPHHARLIEVSVDSIAGKKQSTKTS